MIENASTEQIVVGGASSIVVVLLVLQRVWRILRREHVAGYKDSAEIDVIKLLREEVARHAVSIKEIAAALDIERVARRALAAELDDERRLRRAAENLAEGLRVRIDTLESRLRLLGYTP